MAVRRVEGIESGRLARVEREHAQLGLQPRSLSLTSDGQRVLATVEFEPSPPGGPENRLLVPRRLRDASGRPFWESLPSEDAGRVLSSMGAALASGGELVIAGVLAPQTKRRVAWAVHVDEAPSFEAWSRLPQVEFLRTIATPRATTLVRDPSTAATHIVSLWTDADVPRRSFVGSQEVVATSAGDPVATRGPLDDWMLELLGKTGASVGQLVIARDGGMVFEQAYARSRDGTCPRLSERLRIGSLSKSLTVLALDRALSDRGLTVDEPIPGMLSQLLAGSRGPLRFRDLVEHRAGFPACHDIRHDDPANPISEHSIASALYGDPRPARPGDLLRYLRSLRARPSWLRSGNETIYSNEGYILLGELLAELVTGDAGAYERVLGDLVIGEPHAVTVLAAGRSAASSRAEAPAEASVPTWARDRFGAGELTLPPYLYNGAYLAPAAGVCVSLPTLASAFSRLPRSSAMDPASSTKTMSVVHGLYSGDRGWWSIKCKSRPVRSTPFVRFHHNGRVDGGASMLVHQCPINDAEGPTFTIAVAINRLGALCYDPHGRELFEILKRLEGTWPEARGVQYLSK